ncbi:MAG: exodeoxyribonuclease VII large subunit [Henriciella sp.]
MVDQNTTNLVELSVSELSMSLKRTIETTYDHVRVRGELGRVTIAGSGHLYADLKDEKSVLSTVMWKSQVGRLSFRPEEGLEVVATGRLSTYPGRSNYQLIANDIRPAGAGALMALLEERKKKLAAAGLFDPAHKQPLPFLPTTIGVVTSPTGAVIRDILHRLSDRFPVRVILWPVLVQGDMAAEQITAAIDGFNQMRPPERPDILIVGRGGGSIEDLWPFNEENVVRAAFNSTIPLISAVGHEVDHTLIDYVADKRAPTPTGAAEFAVPVRSDLVLSLQDLGQRQKHALTRYVKRQRDRFAAARLPRAERLLEIKRQQFDLLASQLGNSIRHLTSKRRLQLTSASAALRTDLLRSDLRRSHKRLADIANRTEPAIRRLLQQKTQKLDSEAKTLETLSYQSTLRRGYSLVLGPDGALVKSARAASGLKSFSVKFGDGDVSAVPTPSETEKKPSKRARKSSAQTPEKPDQGDLF